MKSELKMNVLNGHIERKKEDILGHKTEDILLFYFVTLLHLCLERLNV